MKRDKFYLDTNMLVFLVRCQWKELTKETKHLLNGNETTLLVSSVCLIEFIHLCQKGRLYWWDKNDKRPLDEKIKCFLQERNITIDPLLEKDLMILANLPYYGDHNDPTDRAIVAQAISRHIPLISTDWSFDRYTTYGLDLVFNER